MRVSEKLLLIPTLALFAACHDTGVSPTDGTGRSPADLPQTEREGYPTPGELRTGWILDRNGEPTQVTYEVHDGLAIWEGDIVLGEVDRIARTREEMVGPAGQRRGVVIDGSSRRWAGGVVPYVIDSSLPSQYRVTDAIAHIEANTVGVDFVPRTTQTDYVRIVSSGGCSSYVGRQGGQQYLYLGSGCSTGNTIHELLHALGMYHEQSRCDRDTYVTIHWGNIQSGYSGNFNKQCTGATDVLGYDEGSIMHYGPYAFSANGQKTITSNRGLEHLMGQRSGMSTTDVGTVDWMYPRPLSVSISGKQYVTLHESAKYTATPANGTAPYTYEWRSRQYSPTYGWGAWQSWFSTGSNNYTYASIHSCGLTQNQLEVRVTDAGGKQATRSYTIYVTNPC